MFDRKERDLFNDGSSEPIISIVTDELGDLDFDIDEKYLKEEIPILALRNTIIFPGTNLPITVARTKSLKALKTLQGKKGIIGLVCQKDANTEDPEQNDLYDIGVLGEIIRVIEIPNDPNVTVILQGKKRFRLDQITQTEPYLKARYTVKEHTAATEDDKEYEVLLDSIRDLTIHMLRMYGDPPKS